MVLLDGHTSQFLRLIGILAWHLILFYKFPKVSTCIMLIFAECSFPLKLGIIFYLILLELVPILQCQIGKGRAQLCVCHFLLSAPSYCCLSNDDSFFHNPMTSWLDQCRRYSYLYLIIVESFLLGIIFKTSYCNLSLSLSFLPTKCEEKLPNCRWKAKTLTSET